MSNIVFNVSKGRVVEFYNRVKSNDPATSRFVLVPIESSGREAEATIEDSLTLAEVLDGTTNEQSTMGRKYLTDSDLAALPGPDTTNNRYDVSLPTVTWTLPDGNAIDRMVIAYDPAAGADNTIIPMTWFDCSDDPNGAHDISLTTGVFYRAS